MSYAPGDCVGVEAYGGTVHHVGIVTDEIGADGCPRVISTSQKWRHVIEQDWSDFAAGGEVRPIKWFSLYSPAETVVRARARLGRPYDLLRYNCEHLVKDVFGSAIESPQARRVGWIAAAAASLGAAAFWAWGGHE